MLFFFLHKLYSCPSRALLKWPRITCINASTVLSYLKCIYVKFVSGEYIPKNSEQNLLLLVFIFLRSLCSMSIWGKCSLQGSITYCFISFFSWIGTCTTEWGGNTVRLFSISWRNCFLRSRENTLLLPSNVETTILQIQHILKKVMYCSVEYDLNPIFIYVGQKKKIHRYFRTRCCIHHLKAYAFDFDVLLTFSNIIVTSV